MLNNKNYAIMKKATLYQVTYFGNICGILEKEIELYATSLRELKTYIKKNAEHKGYASKCGNILVYSKELDKLWTATSLKCNFSQI